MGLSWQQGPLGQNPSGRFLAAGMPARLPYAEPLRRRMSVELGGVRVAQSDDAVLLFEPGRYPVAYFPLADVAPGALRPTDHRTEHPDLGETAWFAVVGGRAVPRGAWQHVAPPEAASLLRDTVAFAWRQMDAFYEEDERILGHKGVASYYDVGVARLAAWSYRAPFDPMARIADLVSFEPDRVEVVIDGRRLEAAPGQTVVAHGMDRNLGLTEAGAVVFVAPAAVR